MSVVKARGSNQDILYSLYENHFAGDKMKYIVTFVKNRFILMLATKKSIYCLLKVKNVEKIMPNTDSKNAKKDSIKVYDFRRYHLQWKINN